MQLVVDLTSFCAIPTVAVLVFWVTAHVTPALLVVSIVETAASVGLAVLVIRYADLRILADQ